MILPKRHRVCAAYSEAPAGWRSSEARQPLMGVITVSKSKGMVVLDPIAEENRRYGVISRISSMVSMPYRSRHLSKITRVNGGLRVTITSGADEVASGIYPRKFELYLLTMVATKDPSWDTSTFTLHINGSFRDFMRAVGSTIGGRQAAVLKLQMERHWKSTIGIWDDRDPDYTRGMQFVVARQMSAYWGEKDSQETLDNSWVSFSPEYIAMLTKKVVPVDLSIVAALDSPMALDIYWLAARRLYKGPAPAVVTWDQLRLQFGSEASEMWKFRQTFKSALSMVQQHWKDLHVSYEGNRVILSAYTHTVPTAAERKALAKLRKTAAAEAHEARLSFSSENSPESASRSHEESSMTRTVVDLPSEYTSVVDTRYGTIYPFNDGTLLGCSQLVKGHLEGDSEMSSCPVCNGNSDNRATHGTIDAVEMKTIRIY